MSGTIRFALLIAVLARVSAAHDIITTKLTFTRDISRIFARHCVTCHGESAAIPLATYEQSRPWAVSIKEQVLSRAMPPFGAVKGFGTLKPDGALSQEDITIIAAWVIGGAPKGDPAHLPKIAEASTSAPSASPMEDGCEVFTRTVLRKSLDVSGLKPMTNEPVRSTRIVAALPDGQTIPLVWLYNYDPRFARVFQFREPVALPVGTVVTASAPLRYTLEVARTVRQASR